MARKRKIKTVSLVHRQPAKMEINAGERGTIPDRINEIDFQLNYLGGPLEENSPEK